MLWDTISDSIPTGTAMSSLSANLSSGRELAPPA